MTENESATTGAFDAAVSTLEAEKGIQNPNGALDLLVNGPDTLTTSQTHRLLRLALQQSAIAEVRTATGEPISETWREGWKQLASSLRDALCQAVTPPNFNRLLDELEQATRAAAAAPAFDAHMRRLEAGLTCQRALIGFHWAAEDNAYRRREIELSRLIASDATESDRVDAAKQLIHEIARYRQIYLPRLQQLASEIAQDYKKCAALVPFFAGEEHPHLQVRRWNELTARALTSRQSATELVVLMLDLDGLLANEMVSGNMVKPLVDGREVPALNERATAFLKESALRSVSLREVVAQEKEFDDERGALVEKLIPNPPKPSVDVPLPASPALRRVHPIERKAWFRRAKICWWGAVGLWLILSWLVFPDPGSAFTSSLFGLLLLGGLRAAVLYVVLGRPTVRERIGSGYVDLDELEEEVFPSAPTNGAEFAALRTRYGRRVPTQVVKAFIDQQLAGVRAEKRQAFQDLDRQGKSMSIDVVRSTLASSSSGADSADYRAFCERLLLRLEVEYGSEVPISVIAEIVDSEL